MPIKVFSSPFKVTQEFGVNPDDYAHFGLKAHEGLDLIPITADWSVYSLPYKGKVVRDIDMAAKGGAYGITDTIWYPEIGEAWQYCHLKTNTLYEGQEIEPGTYIGQMGDTGNTKGAHLHINRFKVDSKGYRLDKNNGYLGGIDPLPFLENNSATITQNIAQDHECVKTIQKKDDRIQELDSQIAKLGQKNQDLETACEELKKAIKTVDDYTVSELVGALVRKLKG